MWKDVKSGEDSEEMRGGIYKGVPVETNTDKGPQRIQTDWPAILVTSVEESADCKISSAVCLEEKIGKEIGKTNANEPFIHQFPSNPLPFPPNDALALSPTTLVTEMTF